MFDIFRLYCFFVYQIFKEMEINIARQYKTQTQKACVRFIIHFGKTRIHSANVTLL